MENFIKIERDALLAMNITYLINLLNYSNDIFNESVFEIAAKFLPHTVKTQLIKDAIHYAVKMKINIERIVDFYKEGTNDVDETLWNLIELKPIRRKYQKDILKCLNELKDKNLYWKKSGIYIKIYEVQQIFDLNELDGKILTLIYVTEAFEATENIVDQLNDYSGKGRNNRYRSNLDAHNISILLGERYSAVKQRLMRNGVIKKAGILDNLNNLDIEIQLFIDGENDKPLLQKFYTEFTGQAVEINDIEIGKNDRDTLNLLYRSRQPGKGVNILLYGQAGTGKTEFARAFGGQNSKNVYEINNETNDDNYEIRRSDNRAMALQACQSKVTNSDSLIIIDEADSMLNTISFFSNNDSEKGAINNLLDKTITFNIWIVNYIYSADPSTLRRFDYTVKFEAFSFSQRKNMWKNLIKKQGLSQRCDDSDIDYLAGKYQVNAAGISMALKHAKAAQEDNNAENNFLPIVENLLKAHTKVISGKDVPESEKESFAPQYSLEGLNIKGNTAVILQSLDRFNQHLENDSDGKFPLRNLNLLMYGPPGTGKTEFAKYSARRLKRRLISKTASGLLSMWVGGTEQNIAEAFREAQTDKAVLFLDEIDSLLFSREGASKSWELSQVNELLAQMEKFKGIFIACTNMKDLMDSAAMRRFNFKLMFDYLKPQGCERFYKIFLQPLVNKPLRVAQKSTLIQISLLTPGDFKNVYQQNALLPQGEITHDSLIEALRLEVENKNEQRNTIGF